MSEQENPQPPAPAEAPSAPAPSPTRPDRPGGGGGGGRPHYGGPREGRGAPREGGAPGGAAPRRGKRQFFRKRKVCRFCTDKIDFIDYKKAEMLTPFIQDRGKIMPRRLTGTCSRHQRWLCEAIKRARNIALLPFATEL